MRGRDRRELEGIYALVLMHRDEPQKTRGGAHGAAAGGRAGRRGALPGLGHPGPPALHPRLRLPRGRRRRDGHAGQLRHHRRARGGRRARAPADHLGPGAGGEGRLPPLHAEGDPRAAARRCATPCSAGSASRRATSTSRSWAPAADDADGARSGSRSWPAARAGTRPWSASSSSSRWRGSRARWTTAASSATASPSSGTETLAVGHQPERRDRRHPGRLPRGQEAAARCPSPSATSRAR